MRTTYGRALLTEAIATNEDLNRFVLSVNQIPDITEVQEGTVMQLIGLQEGFVTTHFYRADVSEDRWTDLSSNTGSNKQVTFTGNEKASWQFELTYDEEEGEFVLTPYLVFSWTQPYTLNEGTKVVNPGLLYTCVVRKSDMYSENINDGRQIVSVNAPGANLRQSCSVYDRDALERSDDRSIKFKYTIFHVYKSGDVLFEQVGA